MRGVRESVLVYVVDDDDAVRDSLAVLLEPEGFVVTLFASADEFLEEIGKHHPGGGGKSCLLLDLHMPGKGGQELLDVLSKRDNRIPVVIMTGKADDKSKSRALTSGAAAFLEKPVDADLLIDTIRASLYSS